MKKFRPCRLFASPLSYLKHMSFETVIYELNGSVATIQMNRPDALNALSLQLGTDLKAAVEKAIAEEVRAVVLTGSGWAFCSGGDLREM